MTEFEAALQECLLDLEQGNSNVDECLKRHSEYAGQLEPVLLTSAYLQQGGEVRFSDAFKRRVRTKLLQQMYAHPRKPARSNFMFMRLAGSLVALFLVLLVAGTAYAQSALPGYPFYAWKLASENIWRSVSPDPIGTDLAIAERRADELVAVRNDPNVYPVTLKAYLGVLDRLNSETNAGNKERILAALDSQLEQLNRSGIVLPPMHQDLLPPPDVPTLIPVSTPVATPLPVLETPQISPTDLPHIVPTVQVPSKIIPTTDVLPKKIPTIEIPSSIP